MHRLSTANAAREIGIRPDHLTEIESSDNIGGVTDEQLARAAKLYDVSAEFLRGL